MIQLAEQCRTDEFQTGKPPAGEAGMCVAKSISREYFSCWNGTFHGHQMITPQRAWERRGSQTGNPEYPWRWATLAELLASGLTEAEALPMLHESQRPKATESNGLWYPPQQEGFGPWVEHTGDEQPIADDAVCHVLLHKEREQKRVAFGAGVAEGWDWESGFSESIIAYCVQLPASAPAKTEQKAAEPEKRTDQQRDDEGLLNGVWKRWEQRQAQKPAPVAPAAEEPPEGLMHEHRADKWGRAGLWRVL